MHQAEREAEMALCFTQEEKDMPENVSGVYRNF